MNIRLWVLVIGASSALAAAAPSAQQAGQKQTPTFRTTIDVARVTVRALDRNRQPVRDLKKEEFEVLLDGVPKPIVAFVTEDVAGPVTPSAPWMRDVAPDVASNIPADGSSRPRLIVMILDDALTPDLDTLTTAKAIARNAIDQLGPNDLVSIVFTRDNRAPQDFTADRARLLAAVDRMQIGFHPRDGGLWGYANLRSIKVLRAAVEYLRGVPDFRSLVVYVTVGPGAAAGTAAKIAGLGNDGSADHEIELGLSRTFTDVTGEAHAAGVPVYGFSTLGLIPPMPSYPLHGVPYGAGIPSRQANERYLNLRQISDASGGHAYGLDNKPARFVPRVFAENSLYYTLGYEADGPMADGRYRRIQVRVKREGVSIEPGGERMFFSPKADATAPAIPLTTRALSEIVPLADEPLHLAAAAVAAPDPPAKGDVLATLVLALGVDVPGSKTSGDDIEIELRVFDGEGRRQVVVQTQQARLPASPNRERAYDVLTTLTLKPGRYNLRVSASSLTRGRSGSVYTDIAIPNYASAPLSVSDVVIESAAGRTATPGNATGGVLPVTPTTQRDFSQADRAAAFLRVYWGRNKPATPVTVSASVTDADNRTVFSRVTALAAPAGAGLRSADYRLDLPLATLKPGEFVLTLDARAASVAPITRHVRLRVRQATAPNGKR